MAQKSVESSYDWELYTQLISFMNEAVWVWDEHERTVYANPKFCEIMEYSLEEMIGRESYDFWDPESSKTVKKTNQNERKSGRASSYEGNLLTKNGKNVPVLLSGAPLPNGGTVWIMTDLRDLRKKEKSERILSQAVEQAGDGIMLISLDGHILSWNRWARKIFGYKSEEVEGKDIAFLFPSVTPSAIWNIHKDKFESVEMSVPSKDEWQRTVNISITPVHEKWGWHEPIFLCIVRDITLQKKADIELASRYQKIKDAYEWLGKIQRQNDYINDLINIVTHGYDPKKIFHTVINGLMIISGSDACLIRILDPESKELTIKAHFGFESDMRSFKSVPFLWSWTEQAILTGTPYQIMDLATERHSPMVKQLLSEHFSSAVTVVLNSRSGCVGSITFLMKSWSNLDFYENEFLQRYIKLVEIVMNTIKH